MAKLTPISSTPTRRSIPTAGIDHRRETWTRGSSCGACVWRPVSRNHESRVSGLTRSRADRSWEQCVESLLDTPLKPVSRSAERNDAYPDPDHELFTAGLPLSEREAAAHGRYPRALRTTACGGGL